MDLNIQMSLSMYIIEIIFVFVQTAKRAKESKLNFFFFFMNTIVKTRMWFEHKGLLLVIITGLRNHSLTTKKITC